MIEPDQHNSAAGKEVASDAGAARNFMLRLASAAVLAPFALWCTYVGGGLFLCVCGLVAGAIFWEWSSLVTGRADPPVFATGLATLLVAAAFVAESDAIAALGAIGVGALAVWAITVWRPRGKPDGTRPIWLAGGVVYAGLALLGPSLLRNDPELGLVALLFLFATVWVTDILAYLVGRAAGGPLLWPRLSPKKTWTGAIGGLVGGVAAGTLVAYASGGIWPLAAGVLALVLSIVAQCGDLFESGVKRRFGVKDASGLIPGHGGVMDRLDGFLVAAAVAVVIAIARHGLPEGLAAPAQGLLVW